MASNSTIAHRFANRDYNFERGLKGNSTHISGKNYYSYSTVFGQWVDEKVCLVYQGETSVTSHKHQLWGSMFPDDVVVFPYSDGGGSRSWYSWSGCNLLGWDNEFKYSHRVRLMFYWTDEIYDALLAIKESKKKGLRECAERAIDEYWAYVEKLCSMYKDTTINKLLKEKRIDDTWSVKKKMIKYLNDDKRDVTELVDIMFGEGTWQRYDDAGETYRKADRTKRKMLELADRLGISNPYQSYNCSGWKASMTPKEVRALTAKERNEVHFATIMAKERYDHREEREEKQKKNFRNAYKWIVGFEPKKKSWGGGYENDVHNNCVNKDSGVVYECSGEYISRFYWCDTDVSFDYDSFRKSEDKEQWIADFYAKCKEVADNRKAISILRWAKANTREKVHSYDDDIYILDEKLTDIGMDAESLAIVTEFIRKQDKYFADKEARRRAERIRIEAERREKEQEELRLKQVKQEQIDECMARGLDGCRDLWRNHLTTLWGAKDAVNEIVCDENEDFYYGGNVLLRFNLNKDKVETSKAIRIPVEVCKKMWGIVSKWHENPASFKPMTIDTKGSGKYQIISYKNDKLTAGCHTIAYAEMERMYNAIESL